MPEKKHPAKGDYAEGERTEPKSDDGRTTPKASGRSRSPTTAGLRRRRADGAEVRRAAGLRPRRAEDRRLTSIERSHVLRWLDGATDRLLVPVRRSGVEER